MNANSIGDRSSSHALKNLEIWQSIKSVNRIGLLLILFVSISVTVTFLIGFKAIPIESKGVYIGSLVSSTLITLITILATASILKKNVGVGEADKENDIRDYWTCLKEEGFEEAERRFDSLRPHIISNEVVKAELDKYPFSSLAPMRGLIDKKIFTEAEMIQKFLDEVKYERSREELFDKCQKEMFEYASKAIKNNPKIKKSLQLSLAEGLKKHYFSEETKPALALPLASDKMAKIPEEHRTILKELGFFNRFEGEVCFLL